MNKRCELIEETCMQLPGDGKQLAREKIERLLNELQSGWIVNQLGHLHKIYKFSNFVEAMNFANQIADIAEQEDHHPELTVSYGQCIIEIWTHHVNSLTKNDFILAVKIDDICRK